MFLSTSINPIVAVPLSLLQGAFCVASESSNCKSHYFMAQNDKERDSWIEAVNRAKLVLQLLSHQLCVYMWCVTVSINAFLTAFRK